MSGQPAYNKLKVTRKDSGGSYWRRSRRFVTFFIDRRDSFGLCEHRQVTFSEWEVVRALRAAGFTVFTPEDLR